MGVVYEYRLSGRRPTVWLSALVFAGIAGVLAWEGAAFIFWLPLLLGGGLVLWALIRNPVNGLQVTEDRLILSPWREPREVPLKEIETVQYEEWSDSTDMFLLMKSGDTVKVSSLDMPPVGTLRTVLSGKEIEVVER